MNWRENFPPTENDGKSLRRIRRLHVFLRCCRAAVASALAVVVGALEMVVEKWMLLERFLFNSFSSLLLLPLLLLLFRTEGTLHEYVSEDFFWQLLLLNSLSTTLTLRHPSLRSFVWECSWKCDFNFPGKLRQDNYSCLRWRLARRRRRSEKIKITFSK